MQDPSEQRSIRRFNMQLPVSVQSQEGGVAIEGTTRDVSARGIFIVLDSELAENSPLEFTLTLPPEITMTRSVSVRCKGKVLRVTRQATGSVGVVAMIDNYSFVPEEAAKAAGGEGNL
jgi:hypothetical protein